MKISKRKSKELYNVIHEEIMNLRVKVASMPAETITTKEVDSLLSALMLSASQKAIELFTTY